MLFNSSEKLAHGVSYPDPIQGFVETVRRLVLDPTEFFRSLPRQGDFINPAIFALICYEVFVILGGLLALVGLSGDRGFGGLIASIILAPIFLAIGLLIGSGIIHLLVKLIVGPQNAGFEATFRVVSYAQVVNLVSWIPYWSSARPLQFLSGCRRCSGVSRHHHGQGSPRGARTGCRAASAGSDAGAPSRRSPVLRHPALECIMDSGR